MRRSTSTEGLSVEKRSAYSWAVEGGMKRSRQVMPTVDGGTTGRGDDGIEDFIAVEWSTAATAFEKTFIEK